MLKTAFVRRLADAPPEMLRWTLDLPANSAAVDVSSGELRVQGWMLLRAPGEAAPAVVVRAADAPQGEVQRHPFNCGRPDVIDRVLHEPTAGHPQLRCGFKCSVPVSALPVEVGFQWGDHEPFWAASISLQETMQVIEGAEKWQLSNRPEPRADGHYSRTDEAIAAAVMHTANHLDVRAIVALTESGSTALWMSRMRSDIPIYAFTRHAATQRRVTLYRGVYPVDFDVTHPRPEEIYAAIFERLLRDGLAAEGDSIIVTKGEFSGVSGGTNSMKILKVTRRPGT